MQYSSNSNAAIRSIIRSCPTPAGQYRQAVIQGRDRQTALEDYQISRRRLCTQIDRKRAEIAQKHDEAKHLTRLQRPHCERDILAADIELLELDIAQLLLEIQRCDQLVEDAARELEICNMERDRIINESGINFAVLSSDEFQVLMDGDYRVKQLRWAAARTLAGAVGCDIEFAESLLELPEGDRAQFLADSNDLVLPMLPQPDVSELEGSYESA